MEETYHKLTQIIKNATNIIFMTHQNMDLDGFGSCLALSEVASSFKKENYILISKNQKNTSIIKSLKKIEQAKININYIYKNNVKNIINDGTVIIILDVHKPTIVEMPELLTTKNIVVIDHHLKCKQYIQNTVLTYINSTLSSAIEFVTLYLKYLNKTVEPLIASLMLAGMEIDTNSFNVKTTSQTFAAASHLLKLGADNEIKLEILKEGKDEYIERQKYLENSFVYNNNIAICPLSNKIVCNNVLAQIAESMLQFDNIEMSFCIGYIKENQVGISARSIGNHNVEEIMKKLNGGGHVTEAATQIDDINIESATNMLMNELEKLNN